jgi:hypothetical protein
VSTAHVARARRTGAVTRDRRAAHGNTRAGRARITARLAHSGARSVATHSCARGADFHAVS